MTEINRQQAMMRIRAGNEVICQVRKGEFETLSTMEDLKKAVLFEQEKIYDKLKFFTK